jgi:hypothetical protein
MMFGERVLRLPALCHGAIEGGMAAQADIISGF